MLHEPRNPSFLNTKYFADNFCYLLHQLKIFPNEFPTALHNWWLLPGVCGMIQLPLESRSLGVWPCLKKWMDSTDCTWCTLEGSMLGRVCGPGRSGRRVWWGALCEIPKYSIKILHWKKLDYLTHFWLKKNGSHFTAWWPVPFRYSPS